MQMREWRSLDKINAPKTLPLPFFSCLPAEFCPYSILPSSTWDLEPSKEESGAEDEDEVKSKEMVGRRRDVCGKGSFASFHSDTATNKMKSERKMEGWSGVDVQELKTKEMEGQGLANMLDKRLSKP
jgi:hypothetical protein